MNFHLKRIEVCKNRAVRRLSLPLRYCCLLILSHLPARDDVSFPVGSSAWDDSNRGGCRTSAASPGLRLWTPRSTSIPHPLNSNDTHHNIVALYPGYDSLEPLVVLLLFQTVVDAVNELVHHLDHHVQALPLHVVVGVLQYRLQQQAVLGEPLHGLHQDVHQPQPVALLLCLAPGQVSREKLVVRDNIPAVVLTPGLIGAVLEVRLEGLAHLREALAHVLDARRLFVGSHVFDERKQGVPPEADVRSENFGYVGEELFCVYLF